MTKKTYTIRQMTFEEVILAVDWAAREGWNPGLYDADCFYQADPTGFLIGELDGKIIACKSAVKYGEDFGFMGFYMVAPKYRGMGYGYELWKVGHQSLAGRVAGMDGVVEQQANYQKSGYQLAYRNIRMEGVASGHSFTNRHLVGYADVPFAEISRYDHMYFPSLREKFLQCWLAQPESLTQIYMDKGEIQGYGMIRKCRVGHKIGPLFAENESVANVMMEALMAFPDNGTPVFLDIPEPNKGAQRLAAKYNMIKVFETARMYFGPAPAVNLNHIFGVTTFELG